MRVARLGVVALLALFTAHPGRSDVGAWAPGLAPADFDGDGTSDVLFYDAAADTLAIWLVGPGFTLKAGGGFALPPGWQVRGAGKFDADGKDDLVLHHAETGDVVLWLMDGLAIKQGLPVGNARSLAPIAVDRFDKLDDGADLLLSDPSTGIFGIWRLAGGAFLAGDLVGRLPPAVRIGATGDFDLNQPPDGDADLLLQDEITGDTQLWLLEAGVFQQSVEVPGLVLLDSNPFQQLAGGAPLDAAGVADDLLLANDPGTYSLSSLWAVGLQSATPGWWNFRCLVGGGWGLSYPWWLGDFDADGLAEALVQDPFEGYVGIWKLAAPTVPYPGGGCPDQSTITGFATLGGPLFTPATEYRVFNQGPAQRSRPIMPSDFDADGVSDVLLRDAVTGAVTVWWLDLEGNVRSQETFPLAPEIEVRTTARIDPHHEAAEVVLYDPASGLVSYWILRGSADPITGNLGVAGAAVPIFAARWDRDRDDREDDLVLWYPDGTIGIWDVAQGAVEGTEVPGRTYLGQRPVAVAERSCGFSQTPLQVNPTLVFYDDKPIPTNDQAEWAWTYTTQLSIQGYTEQSASHVLRIAADLDCDGHVDRIGWDDPPVPGPLVVRAIDRGPAPGWREETVLSATRRGEPVALGDFDADGDLDLLVQDPADGDVLIWFLEDALVVGEKLVGEPGAGLRVVTFGEELPGVAQ